ncbi:hypothetical protein SNEBB_006617 [Seison nebaliae]|nr:hypothetical protein SNEBB_006617 [Seison nebaliae]
MGNSDSSLNKSEKKKRKGKKERNDGADQKTFAIANSSDNLKEKRTAEIENGERTTASSLRCTTNVTGDGSHHQSSAPPKNAIREEKELEIIENSLYQHHHSPEQFQQAKRSPIATKSPTSPTKHLDHVESVSIGRCELEKNSNIRNRTNKPSNKKIENKEEKTDLSMNLPRLSGFKYESQITQKYNDDSIFDPVTGLRHVKTPVGQHAFIEDDLKTSYTPPQSNQYHYPTTQAQQVALDDSEAQLSALEKLEMERDQKIQETLETVSPEYNPHAFVKLKKVGKSFSKTFDESTIEPNQTTSPPKTSPKIPQWKNEMKKRNIKRREKPGKTEPLFLQATPIEKEDDNKNQSDNEPPASPPSFWLQWQIQQEDRKEKYQNRRSIDRSNNEIDNNEQQALFLNKLKPIDVEMKKVETDIDRTSPNTFLKPLQHHLHHPKYFEQPTSPNDSEIFQAKLKPTKNQNKEENKENDKESSSDRRKILAIRKSLRRTKTKDLSSLAPEEIKEKMKEDNLIDDNEEALIGEIEEKKKKLKQVVQVNRPTTFYQSMAIKLDVDTESPKQSKELFIKGLGWITLAQRDVMRKAHERFKIRQPTLEAVLKPMPVPEFRPPEGDDSEIVVPNEKFEENRSYKTGLKHVQKMFDSDMEYSPLTRQNDELINERDKLKHVPEDEKQTVTRQRTLRYTESTALMSGPAAKLFGRDLSEFANLDIDDLLSKLTDEELEELNNEVDPDDAYLPASERCRDQTIKAPTGPFDRKHLVQHIALASQQEPDWDNLVPFESKTRGKVWKAPPPPEVEVPDDHGLVCTEWDELLENANESEIVDLAAILGFTGLINQVQYHAAVTAKPGAESQSGWNSAAKAEVLPVLPMEPDNDTDPIDSLKKLRNNEESLTSLNLNNIKDLKVDTLEEIVEAMGDNHQLKAVAMANVNLNDKLGKKVADMLDKNEHLESLNIESNNLTPQSMVDIVRAACEHDNIKELRMDNQRQHHLGYAAELAIAQALANNHNIIRLGLSFDFLPARIRVQDALKRNLDERRLNRL